MQDYKKKYEELRSKYINDLDVSYRLGFQKGFEQAQIQAQMQQIEMQTQPSLPPGSDGNQQDPNQDINPENQDISEDNQDINQDISEENDQQGQQTELDQYIEELQNMLGKGEKPSYVQLRQLTLKISDMRKNEKDKKLLPKITKEQKREVSLQKKIVSDVISKWKKQSEETVEDILNQLKDE